MVFFIFNNLKKIGSEQSNVYNFLTGHLDHKALSDVNFLETNFTLMHKVSNSLVDIKSLEDLQRYVAVDFYKMSVNVHDTILRNPKILNTFTAKKCSITDLRGKVDKEME